MSATTPQTTDSKTSSAATHSEGGRHWIPAVLVALGLGSVAMLVGGNWIRERLITEDIVYVRAVLEAQSRTAIAHLWVEELVTGDDVDGAEVSENLELSGSLIESVARATESSWASRVLFDATESEKFAGHVRSARELFDRFAGISRERVSGYEIGLDVGVGSPFDVEYDAIFAGMLTHLRALEDILKLRLVRAEHRAGLIFRVMSIVWILLVVLAVGAIIGHERRRLEAQRALRDSQAQLLQAQKMEAVGRLAGGIAHDINNHLAAITAQCELVKMGADTDDPVVEKMDAAINTATKSATLIKRLLAFSRRQPVLLQVVNVNKVLSGLDAMLSRLIGAEIRLQTELTPDLWRVTIDPAQLEQVLVNLVVNARDAMPRGGDLRITTANRIVGKPKHNGNGANPREYVMISVSDTGTGIPPEIRDKIFEPFYTTKERGQGSGLGLATIDGVVRQNGGYVTLESEVGKGSRFRIFLPRTLEEADVETDEPTVESAVRVRRSAGILLVEDNDELRDSTWEILEKLGYSIYKASHGDEALELFHSHQAEIDMVVSDVIMPGMDGKQLADRLRNERPRLPILFVSGYTDEVILDRGIDESDFDFLAKPFSSLHLVEKVESLLDHAQYRS